MTVQTLSLIVLMLTAAYVVRRWWRTRRVVITLGVIPGAHLAALREADNARDPDVPLLALLCACAVALAAVGCAARQAPAPQLSPVGKAAYYGEQFLAAVEHAQNDTIALVDGGTFTRAQVDPAIRVFVSIGKAGQTTAQALRVIDTTTDAVQKAGAAKTVDASVASMQTLLLGIAKDLSNDAARARVLQIVDALRVGASLLDVLRVVAPYLPIGKPVTWNIKSSGVEQFLFLEGGRYVVVA
jgi:hypothetical protein